MNIDQAMQLAISEALLGAPFVSPNPKVGCVILDSHGNLISKGHHQKFGGPHAEVEALKNLSHEQLNGAHVVVTLEPCAHEGKTSSCAKTLAKLPIAKVTFGLIDPNPLVAGRGVQILKDAGIQVEEYQGHLKSELEETCEEFLWNFRHKKVFVAMKVAQSLDGKIALPNGESKWITGIESREYVHELRSHYDAVLVGKNTVLVDNPNLNIRHPKIKKENKVVILDRSGEIAKRNDLKIFEVHKKENILIVKNIDELYDLGIRSVFVEGGGKIYSYLLENNLVNRIHLFTAPLILGKGISWSDAQLKSRLALRSVRYRQFANDQYLTGLL